MAAAQAGSARRLGAIRASEADLDPDMARSLAFAFLVKALARHAVNAARSAPPADATELPAPSPPEKPPGASPCAASENPRPRQNFFASNRPPPNLENHRERRAVQDLVKDSLKGPRNAEANTVIPADGC